MNNKFLYIIFFLQSSLWAIDMPHERPTEARQAKKTKKFISPLHQLCHEGPIENIIVYLENNDDVSDEINTLEKNITPFARCMGYCQNNKVNENNLKPLIKLFIAKDAQIDLLSIKNLKNNLLRDIFNESAQEESEQISDTKMHNLLLLYYKYSEDKLVFNALDKKNHGKFFDKLKNYLDEISEDYKEDIKYNNKKIAFLNVFDPLYKLFTSKIFNNNIDDKDKYIKIVVSALDDTICAELPHWRLFFEFYSLKDKIESFNYKNIDVKSDAYRNLIKDIDKMSNCFINVDYMNSLYGKKYWLMKIFNNLFKHLNKYYNDELSNYENHDNQFFNCVFDDFVELYKKHLNFLYCNRENDLNKNLYYNLLSSKQPHLLFEKYDFILNIEFTFDDKIIELTKNINFSLSDIRNKDLRVEQKIIDLANLLFTKSSVQYFSDEDVGETINHIWELWDKKLFKTIDFFIKDFKPLLDLILHSRCLSNNKINFLTKLEYFNVEDEKINCYLDYLLVLIIDQFFSIKSTPHKYRIDEKIEILKKQLIFNKNNLIKKIYEKLITKEIPRWCSNKHRVFCSPEYIASLTNIELISDLFDDNIIFDDKECIKLINICIAYNKFDILEFFFQKIKNIQYRIIDIQTTDKEKFFKLFDLLLKYNININNISINKTNLTKYLMDNLTIIDEEQFYKLINNFILHNNLNEVDFFLKNISHKEFTKIIIPKLKDHKKYIELFKTLLKNNINLNDQNFSDSMIHPAKNINVAKFLLDNNIAYKPRWLLKSSYNNSEMIKFLKDNNITLTNDQYYELVNSLMINGDFESMGFFLKKIPHKDFKKITIPELKNHKSYLKLFDILLNNHIDLNHKRFLFIIAYAAQDVDVAEYLLNNKINYTFEWLLKACEHNKPDMIDFFHSKECDFKLTNSTGRTCFIKYIENLYVKENDLEKQIEIRNIINTLLNYGFDIDEEDSNQKSALSYAIERIQPFLVGYLIEKGAKITDKHIKSAASQIPSKLHYLESTKPKKAILAFLLFNNKTNDYTINPNLFNALLKTKNNFFKAIEENNLVKMKKFIDKGYGFLVHAIEDNRHIISKYEEILTPEMHDLLAEFMPSKRGKNTKSARKI